MSLPVWSLVLSADGGPWGVEWAPPPQRVLQRSVHILLECCILVTGRIEVVAKVMFLHVSVILFTGGVSGQGEPPGQGDPPGADTPSPGPWRTPTGVPPPGPGRTPPSKQNPPPASPPRPGRTPPPPGKHTPAYGQREAGTHPTGMHSCYYVFLQAM